MLNPRGGVECDLTVTRLAPDLFFIVTGSAFRVHDFTWIRRHLPTDGSVPARHSTTDLACIGLWGPRTRATPPDVSGDAVSIGAFPYIPYRPIRLAVTRVPALRVSHVRV